MAMAMLLSPLKPLAFSSSAFSQDPSSLSSSCRPAVLLPAMVGGVRRGCLEHWYGVSTVVAKVSRIDWLTNVVGLVDPNYWRRTLNPRLVLNWYLKRVDDAVQEAKEFSQGGTLSFIGHSAGGWLARLYKEEFGFSDISLLSTLGTPHLTCHSWSCSANDPWEGREVLGFRYGFCLMENFCAMVGVAEEEGGRQRTTHVHAPAITVCLA
ncbi:hypothetical protein D8674_020603 [Pyrus ussuriensis x Pyrus communis]|uniref:GPI inositol-deacylase n=1 Tax=Pyrus ussuriensis x Pyrus communis TaxID=2448454 RepID=A0A5N5HGL0_9ROSA|nr:hypothetical protein D8674_020603 [Pyrus ussuriensis x Pyrus communis]